MLPEGPGWGDRVPRTHSRKRPQRGAEGAAGNPTTSCEPLPCAMEAGGAPDSPRERDPRPGAEAGGTPYRPPRAAEGEDTRPQPTPQPGVRGPLFVPSPRRAAVCPRDPAHHPVGSLTPLSSRPPAPEPGPGQTCRPHCTRQNLLERDVKQAPGPGAPLQGAQVTFKCSQRPSRPGPPSRVTHVDAEAHAHAHVYACTRVYSRTVRSRTRRLFDVLPLPQQAFRVAPRPPPPRLSLAL